MPEVGQVFGGKYRLERLVGKGGFATVWAARNVMLDRPVALKILSEAYMGQPGFLPRFLREAKLASRPIHKTVVAVEDIDQTPDGVVFLVMELLEGKTLGDELKGGKRLSVERALEIIQPTLEGLTAAHKRNIIHRDIKPANIFLTNARSTGPPVRILDLGLAKDLRQNDELTAIDQMVGTPSYLAPEMFLGPQVESWAPSADVFACGMLTFRMLAGGLPFDRSVAGLTPVEQFLSRAKFYQSVGQMPGPKRYISSIPDNLDAVVRTAVSLDLAERYADASEMLADLRRSCSGQYHVHTESGAELEDSGEESTFEIEHLGSIELEEVDDGGGAVFPSDMTRVDDNPLGKGIGLDLGAAPSTEYSLEESVQTTPAHHMPVAGRTFDSGSEATTVPGIIRPDLPPPADAGPSRLSEPMPETVSETAATPEERVSAAEAARLDGPDEPGGGRLTTPGSSPGRPPSTPGSNPGPMAPATDGNPGSTLSSPYQLPASATEPPAAPTFADAESSGQGLPQAAPVDIPSQPVQPPQPQPLSQPAAPMQPSAEQSSEMTARSDLVPPTAPNQRPSLPSSEMRPSGQPRKKRGKVLLIAALALGLLLVLLVAGGLGVGWHLGFLGGDPWTSTTTASGQAEEPTPVVPAPDTGQPGPRPPDPRPEPDTTAAVATPPSTANDPEMISLEVHSEPPGATVVLDGESIGNTPFQVSLVRSSEERQLVVESPGYVPVERSVNFDRSQRVEVGLQRTGQ